MKKCAERVIACYQMEEILDVSAYAGAYTRLFVDINFSAPKLLRERNVKGNPIRIHISLAAGSRWIQASII